MKSSRWPTQTIVNDNGDECNGIAPLIISASRVTDIPSFYMPWLINRIEKGHVSWLNPFSGKKSYVSFKNMQVIIFWSKNPKNLLDYTSFFDKRDLFYYVHFTLNDYTKENFERFVPNLQNRIDTFRKLADLLGSDRVIWRYDPIITTPDLTVDELFERISHIARSVKGYTKKLVVSFLEPYAKVMRNLSLHDCKVNLIDESTKSIILKKLQLVGKENSINIHSCAIDSSLLPDDILPNACVDGNLIDFYCQNNSKIQEFLWGSQGKSLFEKHDFKHLKDPGQRPHCKCILSKDIGAYSTCPHGCIYCYANKNESKAFLSWKHHVSEQEHICLP